MTTGTKIKDATAGTLAGTTKVPISTGTNLPEITTISDILTYIQANLSPEFTLAEALTYVEENLNLFENTVVFSGQDAGNTANLIEVLNDSSTAGTGAGVLLAPTAADKAIRNVQIIARNGGSNDMSLEFWLSNGGNPVLIATLRADGVLEVGGVSFDDGANILDFTESGTFDPEFQDTNGLSTISNDIQAGEYVAVGGVCHCWFYVSTDVVTVSGTGIARIGGFPIASKNNNDSNYYTASLSFMQGFAADKVPTTGFLIDNTDYMWLSTRATADARSEQDVKLTVADLTANNTVRGYVAYPID